jgi:hypothetical protein
MGGGRSPAPCGGTWGCAAPHVERSAPRDCSGALQRSPGSLLLGERELLQIGFGAKLHRDTPTEHVWLRCRRACLVRVSFEAGFWPLGLLCQFDPSLSHGKQGQSVLIGHRLCQLVTFLGISPVGVGIVSHRRPFPTWIEPKRLQLELRIGNCSFGASRRVDTRTERNRIHIEAFLARRLGRRCPRARRTGNTQLIAYGWLSWRARRRTKCCLPRWRRCGSDWLNLPRAPESLYLTMPAKTVASADCFFSAQLSLTRQRAAPSDDVSPRSSRTTRRCWSGRHAAAPRAAT